METILKICVGPALLPKEEKCPVNPVYHTVEKTVHTKGYNGIINWRCPFCFAEHRNRISQQKI
jgi:hypothetical protein